MSFRVTGYEHVGIRVSDRESAMAFYAALGWREEKDLPEHSANEMVNADGVYINLIFNGAKQPSARNVLQNEPIKLPGVTHVAFVVERLDELLARLATLNIPLTGGPEVYSGRRRVIFIRDPDGNVLEFNELLTG
jgi:lactoylglutathione lyase